MATNRSGKEVLKHCETVFGKELGTIFYRLNSAWTYAFLKAREYRILFSNRDNLDLINAVGGRFIGSIQDVLYDDILLQLTRITDKAKMGSNKNITIRMFPDFFEDFEMKKKVCELVKGAVQATEFARHWRNKRIVHIDYEYHMDPESNPLKPASLERVQNALNAIHCLLNEVSLVKTGEGYVNSVMSRPIAQQLIANIQIMLEYMLYAESSGEVRPNPHARRLIDEFRALKQQGVEAK